VSKLGKIPRRNSYENQMNPAPPAVPGTKNCGLATWSLVLGILAVVLSVVCIGPLLAIPAVICGHVAHSRIKRAGGPLTGNGLALGGLITGYVSIAMIPIIAMLAAIAVPNFVKARDTAQMNACINHLRQIDAAKQQWALEGGKKDDAVPTAQDLTPFLKDRMLPSCPASGAYTIGAVGVSPTCSIPNHKLSN